MGAAISISDLRKSFGATRALDGVSLDIADGEMVGLLGASGSGKSTLLRHVAGFIAADHGRIEVHGRDIQSGGRLASDVRRRRADIGFVFQQFNLVSRLSVMKNVLVGLLHRTPLWRGLLMRFTVADRQLALEALASVGIEHTAWQRASTLSGGQQQRAAIARCLVQGAKVILADEPIASLDPESARTVMELLASVHRDRGCTVVVSLHQVDYAMRYCTRIVALRAGRIVHDGPAAQLTPEALRGLYGAEVDVLLGRSTPNGSPAAAPPPPSPALAG